MIRNTVRILTVLCALCLFAGVAFAQGGTDQTSEKGTTAGEKKQTKKSTKASTKKVDINSASKEELTAVGIDDATAQKIIDGRPYKTKRDLLTKNIVTKDEYDKIKDQIVAHGGKAAGKKGGKKGTMEQPSTPPK
jgi:DNA uptake protein ComE-like DNA-binding protein